MEIRGGMVLAVGAIISEYRRLSKTVIPPKEITQVAILSAN